jgi:hypothetical protein
METIESGQSQCGEEGDYLSLTQIDGLMKRCQLVLNLIKELTKKFGERWSCTPDPVAIVIRRVLHLRPGDFRQVLLSSVTTS